MVVSVRDVLDESVFVAAGAQVLVGGDLLNRTVSCVSYLTPADEDPIENIGEWIRGGDLVICRAIESAYRCYGNAASWAGFIAVLAKSGAAGLVIERYEGESPPQEVTVFAREAGLPLIELTSYANMSALTESVLTAINASQLALLRKADEIGRSFTSRLVQGGGIRSIVSNLATIVRSPVVLEDASHNVMMTAGDRIEELDWSEHSRTGHDLTTDRVVAGSSHPACLWCEVRLNGHEWGRIHVLHHGRTFDELDRAAVDRAVAGLELALLIDRASADAIDYSHRSLIQDVWQGWLSDTEVGERLHELGFARPPSELQVLVMRRAEEERVGKFAGRVDQAILRVMRDLARRSRVPVVAGVGSNNLVCVSQGAQTAARQLQDEIVQSSRKLLDRYVVGTVRVGAGVSSVTNPVGLRAAIEEADLAAEYATVTRSTALVTKKELGSFAVLLEVKDDGVLHRFVKDQLGPVLDHDATSARKLMPTLETLIACGGMKTTAATSLGIERKSLYARISKLESMLGISLADASAIGTLQLAFSARTLLFLRGVAAHATDG